MLGEVLPYLCCPHCAGGLARHGTALRCDRGHTFDIARQGYVTLVPGRTTGDSAAMVAARAEFLSAGHYAPITEAVVAAAGTAGRCVLDLGAGTGHHLAAVLDAAPGRAGIALEIAKPALKRAARAHPRLGAVGADAWARLPVRDGVVAVALNVFAPRNAAELTRVLEPDGRLVVVAPTGAHLRELVSGLDLLTVAADKAGRVEAALPGFAASARDTVEFTMSLAHHEVLALAGMGPSAWHVAPDQLRDRVAALPAPVEVTASVTVTTYVKGDPSGTR